VASTPGLRFDLSDVGDSRSLRRVLSAVTDAGRVALEVGIFEGAGASVEGGPEGVSPAEYMFFQEFGTSVLEERPWFRTALETHRDKYATALRRGAREILEGKRTREEVLFALGVEVANDLKLSITDFGLVDTGTARNAVTFQVVEDTSFGGLPLGRAELDNAGGE